MKFLLTVSILSLTALTARADLVVPGNHVITKNVGTAIQAEDVYEALPGKSEIISDDASSTVTERTVRNDKNTFGMACLKTTSKKNTSRFGKPRFESTYACYSSKAYGSNAALPEKLPLIESANCR